MHDRLRFVSPADRVLHIKSLPMWRDLSPSDVLPLASVTREVHFEPGDVLLHADQRARHAFLLVDGRVRLQGEEQRVAEVGPPHGVGFLSVLTHDKLGVDVVAATPVIALRIAREDLARAHEDNFRLFERCIRQVAGLAADERPSLTPDAAPCPESRTPARPTASFDFVERLLWLSEMDPFRRASLESVAELTRRQAPVNVEAGATIWDQGDAPDFFLGVVEGALQCHAPSFEAGVPVRSDWLVGLVGALAGQPRACRLVASAPSTLIRMDTAALFDVLEDDPALRGSLLEEVASRAVNAGPTCMTSSEGWDRLSVPSWVEGGLPPAVALGGWKPTFP